MIVVLNQVFGKLLSICGTIRVYESSSSVVNFMKFKIQWKFSVQIEMCWNCKMYTGFQDLIWKKECKISH